MSDVSDRKATRVLSFVLIFLGVFMLLFDIWAALSGIPQESFVIHFLTKSHVPPFIAAGMWVLAIALGLGFEYVTRPKKLP